MKEKIILLFIFLKLFSLCKAQTDSINILRFENPNSLGDKIHDVKPGKKIMLKLIKEKQVYVMNGKITSISDTDFVLKNKYHFKIDDKTILNYRFVNYRDLKIATGILSIPIILFSAVGVMLAYATPYQTPSLGITSIAVGTGGIIMLSQAFMKNSHRAKNWKVSIKKIKG